MNQEKTVDELLEQLAKDAAAVAALKDAERRRDDTIRAIFATAPVRKAPVTRMAEITGFHVRRIHQIRDGV